MLPNLRDLAQHGLSFPDWSWLKIHFPSCYAALSMCPQATLPFLSIHCSGSYQGSRSSFCSWHMKRCSLVTFLTPLWNQWQLRESFPRFCCVFSFFIVMLSCVRLFATWRTVARQAPLSVEFSRQEYRSGWVAVPCSRGSWKDRTCISGVSCIGRQILYQCTTFKGLTWPESHSVVSDSLQPHGL